MQVQKYGLMIMPMKNDFGYEMSLMELTEWCLHSKASWESVPSGSVERLHTQTARQTETAQSELSETLQKQKNQFNQYNKHLMSFHHQILSFDSLWLQYYKSKQSMPRTDAREGIDLSEKKLNSARLT